VIVSGGDTRIEVGERVLADESNAMAERALRLDRKPPNITEGFPNKADLLGGRGRNRTCDPLVVMGVLPVHA
jgi:hypothetical protein